MEIEAKALAVVLGGGWSTFLGGAISQMLQNFINHPGLGNEGEDAHWGSTFWAYQRVCLIHPSDQIGSSPMEF
jgi:hypothetical protein